MVQKSTQREVFFIVAVYAVFCTFWVVMSALYLGKLSDPQILARITIAKELGFILCSVGLLYLLIHRLCGRISQSSGQAMQQSDSQLQTILQTIPDLVWLKDINGVYLSCNREYEIFIGEEKTKIIGKTTYDFFSKERADIFRDHDRRAHLAGKPLRSEEWVTYPSDGRKVLLETIRTPMFDSLGVFIGVLGIGRDITERKQGNNERPGKGDHSSQDGSADNLTGTLNTLLSNVVANLNLVKSLLEPDSRAGVPIASTEQAALRAAELVQHLGKSPRAPQPVLQLVSPRELVEQTLSQSLQGSNVRGVAEIAESVDAIEADRQQISQVMHNIITNAAQAMPGGGTLLVKADNLTLEENNSLSLPVGSYVRFAFTDHGHGISRENIGKIFYPFFSTKPEAKGLGLAFASSVITKHGGFIGARSMTGRGTTITILLPSSTPGHDESTMNSETQVHQTQPVHAQMATEDQTAA